ncbi:phage antirepressor KilAC domain-containing protein [Corynebacterium mastitidis]|uniref:Phage antirepressor Ant n=1 Tax=Corynebacterium mastitidis TaxID=161890 RepID=A0A2N0X516_9CORY|nr:phage antirepressor KilAC domain-containing protein [Corynebacterium mastitidis]MCH6197480.1 phage antirepressor KilAC domain-containing protein [Corynebacterium mastitidis]PKF67792.1 phage antirepressor Ant [Corynebacterium mastitidis]
MDVQLFNFRDHQVRVVAAEDGEPCWVASDVAKVLGYRSAPEVSRFVRGRHKGIAILDTPGGKQQMTVLSEAGLYAAIMKSRAKAAEAFQDWVTDEVLPSIRRRGGYLTPAAAEEALTNPDFIIRLATDLKAERARRAELEAQAKLVAPKVLFADAVSASKTSILVGDLAKILRGNGIQVGANRLFAWLRSHGFLVSRKGTDWNMPTQRAMELGLFRVKETTVVHSDGHTSLSKTPKITGKGQEYFISRFLDGRFQIEEVA